MDNIMVPFRDNGRLTREEKTFNFKLSSNRIVIEHTYGIVKGRFRILKGVNMYETKIIPEIVMSCCLIHNFAMGCNDEEGVSDGSDSSDDDDDDDKFPTGLQSKVKDVTAAAKRREICQKLSNVTTN